MRPEASLTISCNWHCWLSRLTRLRSHIGWPDPDTRDSTLAPSIDPLALTLWLAQSAGQHLRSFRLDQPACNWENLSILFTFCLGRFQVAHDSITVFNSLTAAARTTRLAGPGQQRLVATSPYRTVGTQLAPTFPCKLSSKCPCWSSFAPARSRLTWYVD